MRHTDEQLREILERSAKLKIRVTSRCAAAMQTLSGALCLVLILAASYAISLVGGKAGSLEPTDYGSLIISTARLGYVVIAVLAFLLGVCATMLCVHLRRQNGKDGQNR